MKNIFLTSAFPAFVFLTVTATASEHDIPLDRAAELTHRYQERHAGENIAFKYTKSR